MASPTRPPHIGILCDYGYTLLPKTGIGVFIYNLIDGLLTLTPCPQITVLAHPTDRHKLKDQEERWGPRVRIFPATVGWSRPLDRLQHLLNGVVQWVERSRAALHARGQQRRARLSQCVQGLLRSEVSAWRTARGQGRRVLPILRAAAVSLVLVLLAPLGWLAAILYLLVFGFILRALGFPLILLRHGQALVERIYFGELRLRAAGCDVWLVPYYGTAIRVPTPHVLVIFDVVYHHVPEVFPEAHRIALDRMIQKRAAVASLIYCGSTFVREHDLEPLLPFAEDRLRLFPLAAPMDWDMACPVTDLDSLRAKYRIGPRFLFYPAGLRYHKNHATLIRALRLLHEEEGAASLELVCTGEGQLSPELRTLIDAEGLRASVHLLGLVPREDIAALYHHAQLVALPSLHEGYGLPVLEALQHGCPIACADIPAFRELLVLSPESVCFFDPKDSGALAQAVRETLERRPLFVELQKEAHARLARRDWHAVARDFLELFEDALTSPALQPQATAEHAREVQHHAA